MKPIGAGISDERLAASGGIHVSGVTKRFVSGRDSTLALDSVDLDVGRERFVTLIGPSGCGKSTLLRLVAGLIAPDAGEVSVFGESPSVACENKHVGFVPQVPALLPWRTVLDNVRLPFQLNRSASRRQARNGGVSTLLDPAEVLAQVGLGDVGHKRPWQLSGGMQQRVAIARAFCFGAPVLLMDEPFSALDELTREVLRFQLLDLWQAHRKTVLFVTHSVPEAVTLSDTVVVMSARPGRVSAVIDVDLPRPRPAGIDDSPEFNAIAAVLRHHLREGWSHGPA